jgi:hemerythrin-like domain-containing protein
MNEGTTGARADAIELLTSHHRDVEQLWSQAQAAHGAGDRGLAGDLGQRIITLLSQHDAIETQILYPTLRDVGQRGDQLAAHSLEEHQKVRELLKAADGDAADPKGWSSLSDAITNVMHHVEEEESQIFPMLRGVGQEELYELGDTMATAMKMAPTHPHPTTPNNPVGATVVGAAAGIVDRVRDALKKAS